MASSEEKMISIFEWTAAGETMHATLLNFILAMTQNPAVQKKAQAEIDSVVRGFFTSPRFPLPHTEIPGNIKVGRLRSPSFDDRPHLPYVNALVKELTRWRVVLPLGISWQASLNKWNILHSHF